MPLIKDKIKKFEVGDLIYIYDSDQPIDFIIHGVIMEQNSKDCHMWDVLVYETVITLNQTFLYKKIHNK